MAQIEKRIVSLRPYYPRFGSGSLTDSLPHSQALQIAPGS
jgi:hypothetical protein